MRRNKRLICALLAGAMLLSASFAENAAPEETAAVTEEPAKAPTKEPTKEPTQEPTKEPAQEPEDETAVPTKEPSPEQTEVPEQMTTEVPTAQPTSETTEEPSTTPEPTAVPDATTEPAGTETPAETEEHSVTIEPSATIEPTATAEPTVTIEPTATATPEPDVEFKISIEGRSVLEADGAYSVQVQSKDAEIVFTWPQVPGADGYRVVIADESGNERYNALQIGTRLAVRVSDYSEGRFTLKLAAVAADEVLASAEITFRLAVQQVNPPQGGRKPGGFGGSSGGRPSGAAAGGEAVYEGFRIIPGEAFATSHASGTGDMQLYGTVELTASDECMTQLVLDDTPMDVSLTNGREFAVSIHENQLLLESEEDGWRISQAALRTLNKSGVDALVLSGETEISIPTDFEFKGSVYGNLRCQGYVSKDFVLILNGGETMVQVDEKLYRLMDGELEEIG